MLSPGWILLMAVLLILLIVSVIFVLSKLFVKYAVNKPKSVKRLLSPEEGEGHKVPAYDSMNRTISFHIPLFWKIIFVGAPVAFLVMFGYSVWQLGELKSELKSARWELWSIDRELENINNNLIDIYFKMR